MKQSNIHKNTINKRRTKNFYLFFVLAGLLFAHPASAESTAAVVVKKAQASTGATTIELTGSFEPQQFARLSPRIDGIVESVLVDDGQQVKQGDILLQLDATLTAIEQSAAAAASHEQKVVRDEARRLLDEHLKLREQNHISASEVAARQSAAEQAQSQYEAALANEKMTAERLARHTLIAPFDGVISKKLTEQGEWVSRENAVFELVSLAPLRVDVMAPQERFNDIAIHSAATILPDALPGQRLSGEVIAKVPVGNANARAFLVRIQVQPAKPSPLPGTSAKVILQSSQSKIARLLISSDALLRHPDGKISVFIVDNGVAQRRIVKTGQVLANGVEILAGIEPGTDIVVRGNEGLRDGQAVQISAAEQ